MEEIHNDKRWVMRGLDDMRRKLQMNNMRS